MAIGRDMERTTSVEQCAAENLIGALEQILAALAPASDGNIGWLRPLAVLRAEIEYSTFRCASVDPVNLADECRELTELLVCSRGDTPFAVRYTEVRRTSPTLAALHDRALSICRILAATPGVPQWAP